METFFVQDPNATNIKIKYKHLTISELGNFIGTYSFLAI
ncbi:hypothetical protein ADICYQ_1183 [Cyclobacterium qasimii M12-11B]|uniref:Uncharacterized protein n=1 Tax=Cyclobacterium qasimii M12-11B TaxID=641524 RepID=S7WSV9_9BACT|nr:hypothetical protein ADICYQ_1183 [Cyclobacterium qasimii M12-11B]